MFAPFLHIMIINYVSLKDIVYNPSRAYQNCKSFTKEGFTFYFVSVKLLDPSYGK
jgi:hypothetical protein